MTHKLSAIIDNRGEKTATLTIQGLLADCRKADRPGGVFEVGTSLLLMEFCTRPGQCARAARRGTENDKATTGKHFDGF